MKIVKYISLVALTFIGLGFGTAQAQENLAQEAYTIFQQNCLLCHGEHGSFTEDLIIELHSTASKRNCYSGQILMPPSSTSG